MVTSVTSFRSGMSDKLVNEEWFLYGIGFSRQLVRKAASTQLSRGGTAQRLVHVVFAPELFCRHCQGRKTTLGVWRCPGPWILVDR